MQVVWTDPALERVDEITLYIAQDDPDAAVRWTVELFDAVEHLAQFLRAAAWSRSSVRVRSVSSSSARIVCSTASAHPWM